MKNKSNIYLKISVVLFFILSISSSIIYWLRPDPYVRPFEYFVILIIMVGIISYEILNFKITGTFLKSIVFIQIFMISTSYILTQNMAYGSPLGVDPWLHVTLSNMIIQQGHVPNLSLEEYSRGFVYYTTMPGFHLLNTTYSLILKLTSIISLLLIGLCSMLLNILFTYLLSKKITHNENISILSVLIMSICDNVIDHCGKSIIPTSLGISLVLIILYLTISMINVPKNKFGITGSMILLAASLAIIHSLSYSFILIQLIIIIFYVFLKYKKANGTLINLFLIFFMIGMIVWAIVSTYYLGGGINMVKGMFIVGATNVDSATYTSKVGTSIFSVMLARSGMLFYFLLAGIGVIYSAFKFKKLFGGFTIVCSFFTIFGLISFLMPSVSGIAHRFWYYSQILCSIFVAILVYSFLKSMRKKIIPLKIILISFVSVLMLFASVSTNDMPLAKDYWERSGFFDSEISSSEFLANFTSGQNIASDMYYNSRLFYFNIDSKYNKYPKTFKELILSKDISVFRGKNLENSRITMGRGKNSNFEYLDEKKIQKLIITGNLNRNIIYSSNNVLIYGY